MAHPEKEAHLADYGSRLLEHLTDAIEDLTSSDR